MTLYHYTARHHLYGGAGEAGPGIVHVGILPNRHPTIALGPHVWLTTEGDWAQGWATRNTIDCDRTEARVEVIIPRSMRNGLLVWQEIEPLVMPEWRAAFVAYADPWSWRVFLGRVHPGWLRAVELRPPDVALVALL